LTVAERLAPRRGEALVPLDEEAVRVAARTLRDAGVDAVAVCFLFSYLNPAHEARAAALIAEEYPDCFVCTSSGVRHGSRSSALPRPYSTPLPGRGPRTISGGWRKGSV
jgi:N-methylhydantoinase A/oxoprolinase/acetone carboxylase beta subunit